MKVISTTKAPAAIGPYSQAIEVNGFVLPQDRGRVIAAGIEHELGGNTDVVITRIGGAGNVAVICQIPHVVCVPARIRRIVKTLRHEVRILSVAAAVEPVGDNIAVPVDLDDRGAVALNRIKVGLRPPIVEAVRGRPFSGFIGLGVDIEGIRGAGIVGIRMAALEIGDVAQTQDVRSGAAGEGR